VFFASKNVFSPRKMQRFEKISHWVAQKIFAAYSFLAKKNATFRKNFSLGASKNFRGVLFSRQEDYNVVKDFLAGWLKNFSRRTVFSPRKSHRFENFSHWVAQKFFAPYSFFAKKIATF
jgi:hypothetical protein